MPKSRFAGFFFFFPSALPLSRAGLYPGRVARTRPEKKGFDAAFPEPDSGRGRAVDGIPLE